MFTTVRAQTMMKLQIISKISIAHGLLHQSLSHKVKGSIAVADDGILYDFLVINDDLAACVEELHSVIQNNKGIKPSETDLLDRLAEEAKKLEL